MIYVSNCLFVDYAVAVDEDNGFVYWNDGHVIKQSTLGGTYIKEVVRTAGKLNIIIIIKLYFRHIYRKRQTPREHIL